MHHHLAARLEPARSEMRIRVAAQQQHLEEQHAGGPNPGAAAEPRQDILADKWLNLEQQEGPGKNGQRMDSHSRILPAAPLQCQRQLAAKRMEGALSVCFLPTF